MKKNKIILDQEFAGDYGGGQDFDRLMSDYHRKVRLQWIKKLSVGSGVMALMLLAWIFYPSADKSSVVISSDVGAVSNPGSASFADSKIPGSDTMAVLPVIPPEVPFKMKTVKASRRESFTTEGGILMEIPAGAFADTGLVEVRYREFSDVEEVLAGGIPMEFDSAGKVYSLESTGLIEVRAFSGNKELQLRKNRKITFLIRQKNKFTELSLFFFNKERSLWTYKGQEKIKWGRSTESATGESAEKPASESALKGELLEKERQLMNLEEPIRPRRADKNAYQFMYRINPDQFPELYGYKKIQFEIASSEGEMIRQINSQQWQKIEMHKNGTGYRAVFSNDLTIKSVQVVPVYVGDASQVESVYQKKYRTYLNQKADLEKQIQGLKKQIEKWPNRHMEKSNADVRILEFAIDSTGLWNVSSIFARAEEGEM